MRVPLRSRSGRRHGSRGMDSLRRGRARAGELVDEAAPLVDRGREAAESLAREAADHVPGRARRRRRRRGAFTLLLLMIVGGVALYLAWQRRDQEPARLVFAPDGPDIAPSPTPEPPQPPVQEMESEPEAAVSSEPLSESSAGEQDGAPTAVPEVQPLTARGELPMPAVATPIIEAAVERPTAVETEPAVEDESADVATVDEVIEPSESTVDFEDAAEADETANYPTADLTEELPVERAAEAAAEPDAELLATEAPAAAERAAAERTPSWLDAAVSETPQQEAPEPAPEVDRSMPLRAPVHGANSLPPSSPAGAPFRPAGDRLPGGRSWPTLPS